MRKRRLRRQGEAAQGRCCSPSARLPCAKGRRRDCTQQPPPSTTPQGSLQRKEPCGVGCCCGRQPAKGFFPQRGRKLAGNKNSPVSRGGKPGCFVLEKNQLPCFRTIRWIWGGANRRKGITSVPTPLLMSIAERFSSSQPLRYRLPASGRRIRKGVKPNRSI